MARAGASRFPAHHRIKQVFVEAVSNAASHVLEPGTSACETLLRNFLR